MNIESLENEVVSLRDKLKQSEEFRVTQEGVRSTQEGVITALKQQINNNATVIVKKSKKRWEIDAFFPN